MIPQIALVASGPQTGPTSWAPRNPAPRNPYPLSAPHLCWSAVHRPARAWRTCTRRPCRYRRGCSAAAPRPGDRRWRPPAWAQSTSWLCARRGRSSGWLFWKQLQAIAGYLISFRNSFSRYLQFLLKSIHVFEKKNANKLHFK